MAFYYISDLHLRAADEPKARALVDFLANLPVRGDSVVLGGDIFDIFIGSDRFFREKFANVLAAIEACAKRGARVFFLEGNHDFHMRGAFSDGDGIHVDIRPGQFALDWEGRKIWICHGDEINRRDYGYLFLRFVTRTLFFRALLRIVPGKFVADIGAWSSGKSREYSEIARIDDGRMEVTRALFREYAKRRVASGFDFVLIGHSHIADRMPFRAGAREGLYVNLGFSAHAVPYLRIAGAGAAAELLSWPKNK